MIDTSNINIVFVNFPNGKVHEAASPNEDGTFTVLIDKNINHEYQMKLLKHAVKHIRQDDFEGCDVQEIESRAHGEEVKEWKSGTF